MLIAVQDTYKFFEDTVNASDVETNEKGEVAVHGSTYIYWTTKVPS